MGGNERSLEPAHFGGTSLQQMHTWVTSGAGASSMHSASEQWKQEQQYMQDLATRVRDRMTQAKAIMESQSGDAVQNAVSPVVMWTEATADNTFVQAQQMQEQGEAFSKLQAAVPNPNELQQVPSDNWFQKAWASISGSKTDSQVAQQHNEQLRQEAVTAFNNYQSTTQGAVSATPTFTPPPPIAADTSVQSNGGGPGVGGFSPAGGGGAGGGTAGGGGAYSGGGGGHASAVSGTPANISGSSGYTAPPTATHSAGVSQAPIAPSFQSPSAASSVGGGGMTGGLSGVIGGLGAAGGAIGGMSGAGGAGGRLGGVSGAGGASEEGSSGRAGAAGRAGSLAAEEEGAAGRGGSNSSSSTAGGAAGRGAGKKGEEDDEHYSPEFLKGDHGFFDDEMPRVAPPVFGE